VLFSFESEEIHNRTLAALGHAGRSEVMCDALASFFTAPPLPVELFGLRFPNPVGLAAGMDKLAAAAPVWPALGFGFSELGGVTWHPQPGNDAPRMFRAVADAALVNRMGFNNPGAEALAAKLAEWRALDRWPAHPVGINLGKSKVTPLDKAAEDYANSFRALREHADFFVVNVSSPNTPNLRQLQDKAALDEVLAAVQEVNAVDDGRKGTEREREKGGGGEREKGGAEFSPLRPFSPAPLLPHHAPRTTHHAKPVLVKVAPDLAFEALDEILELTVTRNIAGIVATNTTITRPETRDEGCLQTYAEQGGLSGRPLRTRSTEVVRHLFRQTRGSLPIIGVGGVLNADDAWEKVTAGASLVQVYTGLVYEGPGIARDIVIGLRERMQQVGVGDLRELVGVAA